MTANLFTTLIAIYLLKYSRKSELPTSESEGKAGFLVEVFSCKLISLTLKSTLHIFSYLKDSLINYLDKNIINK